MMDREKVLQPFIEQQDYMNERVKSGIEQHRKGYFRLNVVDAEGNAVADAQVSIKQKTHEFRIGANLFALGELGSPEKNEEYEHLFADCFNLGTLPFYWKDVEPQQGYLRVEKDAPKIYRRPTIEQCLEFCEKFGIEPKAHCLDYDYFSPDWVHQMNDLQQVRRALYNRFAELSKRYADRIPSWEVVNEALFVPNYEPRVHNTPHYLQNDMIEWDFRTANQCFPANRLIINECRDNIFREYVGNRSGYYMLIERALQKGCRIDSIGMQYHMTEKEEDELSFARKYYSPEFIYQALDRYADFGLPMQITEFSVPSYRNTEEDEEIQTEILKNLYSIWFSHPNMEAIICWDVVDGLEWSPYRCGYLRNDLTPKKAYTMIRDLFHKTWHTEEEAVSDALGKVAFKGFYGDYEVTVKVGTEYVTKPLHLFKAGDREFKITI